MNTTKNWMLDETIQTLQDCHNDKNKMIKQLTVQKISYGRICMSQLLALNTNRNHVSKTIKSIHKELDKELQKRIDEINNADFT